MLKQVALPDGMDDRSQYLVGFLEDFQMDATPRLMSSQPFRQRIQLLTTPYSVLHAASIR